MINTIDCVLAPFIDGQYTSGEGKKTREENLIVIINRAKKIGTMLFAQPTTWEFDWEMPKRPPRNNRRKHSKKSTRRREGRREGFVIYPAIWKTGNPDGRELSKDELMKSPELDISKATITSAAMNLGEDTSHLEGDGLQKREVEEADANASRERLDEQSHANDSSIASTDTVVQEDPNSYNSIGAERRYEQHRPSSPSLSNRDTSTLEQDSILGPGAAEEKPMSNEFLTEKQGCTSSAKAVAAGDENGQQQQQSDSHSSERRRAAESETAAANSEQVEVSHRPVQQPRSLVNERHVEPATPTQPERRHVVRQRPKKIPPDLAYPRVSRSRLMPFFAMKIAGWRRSNRRR